MGLKDYIINFSLIAIFVFAFITFGIQLADNEGAVQGIANDSSLGSFKNSIKGNISTYDSGVNSTMASFTSDEPVTATNAETIQLLSISKIWKGLVSIPYLTYKLTLGFVFNKLFGDVASSIIFYMIIALGGGLLILYAWRAIRTGEVD